MPTLTWKDSRLSANDVAPWDTTIFFVGPSTPLAELVSDSVRWCQQNQGSSLNLMIYCHGSPGHLYICKEGIIRTNLNKLAPLKPYFDEISIHACLIAKGRKGRAFCQLMASVLFAWVTGAEELQYNTGVHTIYGWLDDMRLDGKYYKHLPSGERQGPCTNKILHPRQPLQISTDQ